MTKTTKFTRFFWFYYIWVFLSVFITILKYLILFIFGGTLYSLFGGFSNFVELTTFILSIVAWKHFIKRKYENITFVIPIYIVIYSCLLILYSIIAIILHEFNISVPGIDGLIVLILTAIFSLFEIALCYYILHKFWKNIKKDYVSLKHVILKILTVCGLLAVFTGLIFVSTYLGLDSLGVGLEALSYFLFIAAYIFLIAIIVRTIKPMVKNGKKKKD